ncbi:hypothetical protein ACOME3_007298 [Neoechinorhynchus agilis]
MPKRYPKTSFRPFLHRSPTAEYHFIFLQRNSAIRYSLTTKTFKRRCRSFIKYITHSSVFAEFKAANIRICAVQLSRIFCLMMVRINPDLPLNAKELRITIRISQLYDQRVQKRLLQIFQLASLLSK